MNNLWMIDLKTLEEFFKFVEEIEKEIKKSLDKKERELVFNFFMKNKGLKPIGATELSKDELIKTQADLGKTILDISTNSEGKIQYKITKGKKNDN